MVVYELIIFSAEGPFHIRCGKNYTLYIKLCKSDNADALCGVDDKGDASVFWIEFADEEYFKIILDKKSADNKHKYIALNSERKGSLKITEDSEFEPLKFIYDGAHTIRDFMKYGSRIKAAPCGHYLGYNSSRGKMGCFTSDIINQPAGHDEVDLSLKLDDCS